MMPPTRWGKRADDPPRMNQLRHPHRLGQANVCPGHDADPSGVPPAWAAQARSSHQVPPSCVQAPRHGPKFLLVKAQLL